MARPRRVLRSFYIDPAHWTRPFHFPFPDSSQRFRVRDLRHRVAAAMAASMFSTVKVSNVSLKAAQRDIKEFFSFSGDIVHVEMQSGDELSQVAYITFKDNQGAETAMLLTGATIVDMAVIVTPATDYELPAEVVAALEPKDTKPSALQKAEDIVGTMLAKGFILGRDALDRAKALDEKHQLTSTATARVSSFDKRIGLSEKFSVGTSAVNDKVKEMDQKYQVSEKTKSALAAAEQSVSTAGSAIMKNRYVLTGAAWVTGAFSKVTSAANDVGAKAKEKIAAEQEPKNVEGESAAQSNISEGPVTHRDLDGEFAKIHVSETPEDIPVSTAATVPAITDEEPSKVSPPTDAPKKPESAQGLIL
ncbi:hypothetical protein PAHAL_7G274900 [Panicum hallii]|uniref:RRM domain-containing protein n=1 Tax=Panicum hallii TaxID=206008 RepID=A0A2S3I9W6_9POAL|nr:binding partner of ACD11 1-like [Panicum hallii]PAN39858.1 hypothetical protein PAHAL_7G274900 [Panicum hallii]